MRFIGWVSSIICFLFPVFFVMEFGKYSFILLLFIPFLLSLTMSFIIHSQYKIESKVDKIQKLIEKKDKDISLKE